jgi:putative DNA primase/helicase
MTMDINAATIVEALGGNPTTGMCKCPAHEDRKPSLHVTDGQYRVLVRCFAGCGQGEVVEALRGRGLWPERKKAQTERQANDNELLPWPPFKGWGVRKSDITAYDYEQLRWRHAFRMHYAAHFAKSDITPATYLNNRGLNIVPPSARILPKEGAKYFTNRPFPAMVCIITGEDGLLSGTHVTFLNLDGTAKLESETPRQTFGEVKGGFVVCGEPDPEKPLIIGEGIETTLSAMQLAGGLPGIAAMTAGNLPAIKKLPACSKVIIAADNDKAGRKGAAELAERLEYEGRTVQIALCPVEDEDAARQSDSDQGSLTGTPSTRLSPRSEPGPGTANIIQSGADRSGSPYLRSPITCAGIKPRPIP